MGALPGRADRLAAIGQVVDEAAAPGLRWLERDVEAQPAVGVHGHPAVPLAGAHDHFAAEILVAIGDVERLAPLRPGGGDAAAPHDAIALHLEDIGEIGAHRDLEVETHGHLAIVHDLDVLMQPAVDMAGDHEAERARGDRAVLGEEGAVGLEDERRVRRDGAAVQEIPWLAIGVDRPGADHPCVAEIEPTFARPIDLPVGFGDEDGLSLMDGDLCGADLNLERHVSSSFSMLSEATLGRRGKGERLKAEERKKTWNCTLFLFTHKLIANASPFGKTELSTARRRG